MDEAPAAGPPGAPRLASFPAAVLHALRCPVCGGPLGATAGGLRCGHGHTFDRARQGHVSLRRGGPTPRSADTAAMVAARAELLGSGVYAPVRDALAAAVVDAVDAARPAGPGAGSGGAGDDRETLVADLAGGTGWYLGGVLDRLPDALGVCVELSTPALRRAARAHPRAVAVGADLRERWPLADGSVAVVTSVFGPRDAAETARVLAIGGALVVVTPRPEHLGELVDALGMVAVDAAKDERLARSLPGFTRTTAHDVTEHVLLDRRLARAAAAMGPSAHHTSEAELDARVARLAGTTTVTLAVTVSTWSPPGTTPRA
ncbi:rRNA (guanine-N1)-methyltransferase [Pseudokineococcus basanitobsidens]|uniref:rRNA (Guanine-N1)-methyltransferase n=1 Tax=Pseudokineococcus basanitobsidens TaxID=1926649 RepID=A0ABU8RLN2_9ACTN